MKDPAALIYIDKWLVSTKEMRANAKGWYLNLILHQYDKGELPNDIEELANLCDVRMSEYEEFKQVFEQVLKQKFELNENGCLENSFATEIIRSRETFKEKRSEAGKLSYLLKYYRRNYKNIKGFEDWIKGNLVIDFDIKNEQVLKQVFEQNIELYINIDKDVNKNSSINISSKFLNENIDDNWKPIIEKWLKYKSETKDSYKSEMSLKTMFENLKKISESKIEIATEIVNQSIANNWKGLFELKNSTNGNTKQQNNSSGFTRAGYDPNNGIGGGERLSDKKRPKVFSADNL